MAVGHEAAHIEGAEAVVTSTAVKGDNPEVTPRAPVRILVVPRAVMLAELDAPEEGHRHRRHAWQDHHHLALVTSVLAEAGVDPTVIGGKLNAAGANRAPRLGRIHRGRGRRVRRLFPEPDAGAQPSSQNIDADHMDTYGHDFARLKQAFVEFLHRMPVLRRGHPL